jgi:phage-related protein
MAATEDFDALGVLPGKGTGRIARFATRELKFANGYGQRTNDSLNPVAQDWRVVFDECPVDQRDLVWDFIIARKGTEAFLWTPPGAIAPLQYICKMAEDDPRVGGQVSTASFKFEQVFDL